MRFVPLVPIPSNLFWCALTTHYDHVALRVPQYMEVYVVIFVLVQCLLQMHVCLYFLR